MSVCCPGIPDDPLGSMFTCWVSLPLGRTRLECSRTHVAREGPSAPMMGSGQRVLFVGSLIKGSCLPQKGVVDMGPAILFNLVLLGCVGAFPPDPRGTRIEPGSLCLRGNSSLSLRCVLKQAFHPLSSIGSRTLHPPGFTPSLLVLHSILLHPNSLPESQVPWQPSDE